MTNEINNEIKESLQNDFLKWKETPITKFFFQIVKAQILHQRKALESLYALQTTAENKLIWLGAYSHSINVLEAIINTRSLSDIDPEELERFLNE